MKFGMRNAKCAMKKAGVSLITVLLFMLVATIAATATYKWITSEGRSSASRMMEREAYQSAIAGIESARSWMTYHANETGALIKQYKDGKNVPIKMTGQLAEFIQAGQSFDVWLVGVNTQGTTYTLKIMSIGSARNGGANHSEMAILKVNGLYQVDVPIQIVQVQSPITFDYAYFGGASGGTQSKFNSIVINGDWQGNQGDYPEKFIVTGNATLTGNHNNMGELNCVGGNVTLGNQGITAGQDLFVGGNMTQAKIDITGDAYFNGTVDQEGSTSNHIRIDGSVTLNGTLRTYQSNQDFWTTIGQDLCVADTGRVLSRKAGNNAVFKVSRNVWMPGTYPISTDPSDPGVDNYSSSDKIVLGDKDESLVYIRAGHAWSEYSSLVSNKRWVESTNHPRKCGAQYSYAYNGVEDLNVHICDYGGSDWWPGGSTKPQIYPTKSSKTNLHYIYYMPEGRTDVYFDKYEDNYWKWCTQTGVDNRYGDNRTHCWTYNNNTEMNAYFINFSEKSDATAFTTSYHSQDANHTINVNSKYYRYLNHDGSNVTGSPYCKLASGEEWRPTCGVTPWFTAKGTLINESNENWPTTKPFACADSVLAHCNAIWGEPQAGCDGSRYFIDDPIEIPIDPLEAFAQTSNACPGATSWGNATIVKLNECYANLIQLDSAARKLKLYGQAGYEFLVTKITSEDQNPNINTALNGKFVLIFENKTSLKNSSNIVTTANDSSFVMLYMKKGATLPTDNKKMDHVFIYMAEAADNGTNDASHINIHGTLYFPADSCFHNDFKDANLESDTTLIKALGVAGVVCNKGEPCGGNVVAGVDIADQIGDIANMVLAPDDNYIGVAPQLSVTLESQYENIETIDISKAKNAKGSFIVLPRVIHMKRDAAGTLSHYYNVVTLNTTTPAQVNQVSCNGGFPVTGALNQDGPLQEGYYTCNVDATVNGVQQKMPFWIMVQGEGASAPQVQFADDAVKLAIGNSQAVNLSWEQVDVAQSCEVNIKVTGANNAAWSVAPNVGLQGDFENGFSVTIDPTSAPAEGVFPNPLFTVTNNSSSDGSVLFAITGTSGCLPGNPSVEVIYNNNSITVMRRGIEEYCAAAGPGYNTEGCNAGGAYLEAMLREDCPTMNVGQWVLAIGDNCSVSSENERWSCGITSAVSLERDNIPSGCEVVIPSVNNSAPGPFNPNDEVYLYASLKKVPILFHAAFKGIPENDNQEIVIKVNGDEAKKCSYTSLKTDEDMSNSCDVTVYRGDVVTLTFNPTDPDDFNYWKCVSGADCPSDEPSTVIPYQITITDENTVHAHFGETDKHCFFDEFRDGSGNYRYKRTSVDCAGSSATYCIDDCGSTCESAASINASYPDAKWKLLQGSKSNIDYYDGSVSLKSSATRGMKESEKANLKAIVMSAAQAGKYGDLKAQFVPPREGYSANDGGRATVKNSGLILRSTADASSYLILNVYTDRSNDLYARLCTSGGDCSTPQIIKGDVSPTDIIMVSAHLPNDEDNLVVTVWPNSWSTVSYSTTFVLANGVLPGVESTASNEFVGYSLADPNFKLYGIGWKSETYGSECWETYPTLNCSFRAKFTGGIVPKSPEYVSPWTGLSAWYGGESASCTMEYFYKGDDACNASSSSDPVSCGSGANPYTFTEGGAHGYKDNGNDVRTAWAAVQNCSSIYGEEAAWVTSGVVAHCGAFWVGSPNECSKNYTFSETVSNDEGTYYALTSGTANMRDATLSVELDMAEGHEADIYLFSENVANGSGINDILGAYGRNATHIYSLPYKATRGGTISIPVENISNVEGFNPERIVGVFVKTLDDPSTAVKSVSSVCPNTVSLSGCSATYVSSSNEWQVKGTVTHNDHVTSIEADETTSYITGSVTCGSGYTACSYSGDVVTLGMPDLDAFINADQTYSFKLTVTTDENETLECTPSGKVDAITATCGSITGNSVYQGNGLPAFTYSISGCPDATSCGYKITLVDASTGTGSKVIVNSASSGNFDDRNTPTDAANGEGDELTTGSYKFKLESTNAKRPFSCTSTDQFTVIVPSSSSEESSSSVVSSSSAPVSSSSANVVTNCSFTNSDYKPGEDAYFKFRNLKNGDNPISGLDYKVVPPTGSGLSEITGTTNNSQEIQLSSTFAVGTGTAGSYTLYIKVNGNYESACTATLTLKDISPSNCKYENGQFKAHANNPCAKDGVCTWRIMKGTDTPTTGTAVASGNWTNNDINPTISGKGKYTLWINDIKYETCSITIKPTVTCPNTKKSFTINQPATFKAESLSNCDGGCDYRLERTSGGTVFATSDAGTYSLVSTGIPFAENPSVAEDNIAYTFTVFDHDDHTIKDTCQGVMAFTAASACETVTWNITGDNSNSASPSPKYPWKSCATITTSRICFGQLQIKAPPACENKTGRWNGVSFQLQGNGPPTKDFSTNPMPNTINNLVIDDCDSIRSVYMTGCETVSAATSAPTITNCPTSSIVAKPGANVSLPMTLSNCKVTDGCSYTISASGYPGASGTVYGSKLPDLGGASADKTTVTYTLSVSNSKGSATTCTSFDVYYDSDAREEGNAYNWATFGPGKYKLYCNGQSGTKNMQTRNCNGGTAGKAWFDPTISFYNDYGGCNGQASVSFPLNLDVPSGGSVEIHCW